MNKTLMLIAIGTFTLGLGPAFAADSSDSRPGMGMGRMMMGGGMQPAAEERESAGIPNQMKTRHLARMRSHLEAVHDIIDALAHGEFGAASKTARQELAMRPGMGGKGMGMGQGQAMGGMCKGMKNKDFKAIGMEFHQSAGKLADVLEKGDMKASLNALSNTMNYCISCHASFRQ